MAARCLVRKCARQRTKREDGAKAAGWCGGCRVVLGELQATFHPAVASTLLLSALTAAIE